MKYLSSFKGKEILVLVLDRHAMKTWLFFVPYKHFWARDIIFISFVYGLISCFEKNHVAYMISVLYCVVITSQTCSV